MNLIANSHTVSYRPVFWTTFEISWNSTDPLLCHEFNWILWIWLPMHSVPAEDKLYLVQLFWVIFAKWTLVDETPSIVRYLHGFQVLVNREMNFHILYQEDSFLNNKETLIPSWRTLLYGRSLISGAFGLKVTHSQHLVVPEPHHNSLVI